VHRCIRLARPCSPLAVTRHTTEGTFQLKAGVVRGAGGTRSRREHDTDTLPSGAARPSRRLQWAGRARTLQWEAVGGRRDRRASRWGGTGHARV
jgi:hypothetical protein